MEGPGAGRAREAGWLLLAAAICLAPRIGFAHAFPTVPYSDFNNLVNFAVALTRPGWDATWPYWQFFGIGLPYALSLVLRVVPGPPAEVARYATAVVTGLAALSPFVIWRGAFRLRTRMASAILLGLWPGHVFFSGVVAQDNWILLPSVALGALAVRSLVRNEAWPVASALLLCAAGAIRQEMFLALLPPALAAAGAFRQETRRGRRLAVWAATAVVCLVAIAGLRWAGSGRFSVGTEHPGLAMLGSVTPGAGTAYWAFPQVYFAAHAPELEERWAEMKARALPLAVREVARRPFFHAVRMLAGGVNCLLRTDSTSLGQAVGPAAMPPSHRARGEALVRRAQGALDRMPQVALGVFFGLLLLGVGPRAPMLVLAAAILLKTGVHAATTVQPRYLVVVGALALMGVALGLFEWAPAVPRWRTVAAVLAGLMIALAAGRVAKVTEGYVLGNEEQLTYRFSVWHRVKSPRLRCTMATGLLHLAEGMASIRPLRPNPPPGDETTAVCRLEGARAEEPVALEIEDVYPRGRLPGRVVQVVTVDGREALRHDIAAEPWTGWNRVSLVNERGGPATDVVISVRAIRPEPGWGWGFAAGTMVRLARITPPPSPGP